MKFLSLLCPVCLQKYNLEDHVPKILQCGHTICIKCLEIILKGNHSRCPLDKKNFSDEVSKVEDFPVNFTVQGLIEENPQWEVCSVHGERIKLMCFTDRCKVCAYCALNGAHREHEVKHINEIKPDIDSKKQKLETVLKDIDSYYNKVSNLLDQRREEALKILEERFKEFLFIIRMRRGELAYDINTYFDQEKMRLSAIVGKESSIKSQLNSKINSYKNYSKSQDPFSLLEEDISNFTIDFDPGHLKKSIEEATEKLRDKLGAFDSALVDCLHLLNNVKTPNKEFMEKLNINYLNIQDNGEYDVDAGNSSFYVESSARLTSLKPCVQLLIEDNERKNNFISSKDFKGISDINIEIKKTEMVESELDLIDRITYRMNKIKNVYISTKKIEEKFFEETSLLDLCSTVLYKPDLLQSLVLEFSHTKCGDLIFVLLGKNILPKAMFLKNLALLFSRCNITDRGIMALSTYALPFMGSLSSLSIDLSNTLVSDHELGNLLLNIPNVQVLSLNFKETKISSQSVENFVQNKLPILTDLKGFEMVLTDTIVSGDLKSQVQEIKKEIAAKSQDLLSD